MSDLSLFDKISAEIKTFCGPMAAIVVTDKESSEFAMNQLKQVKWMEKQVEEKRKELVAPLNNHVKQINEYARQISTPIGEAEFHIKKQLRNYEVELEKIRLEQFRAAEQERRKQAAEAEAALEKQRKDAEMAAMFLGTEEATALATQLEVDTQKVAAELEALHSQVVTQIDSQRVSGARRTWTFEILDASQVPAQFLMVNEKAIREAVRAGAREIPGVKIYQEVSVVAR